MNKELIDKILRLRRDMIIEDILPKWREEHKKLNKLLEFEVRFMGVSNVYLLKIRQRKNFMKHFTDNVIKKCENKKQ